MLVDSVHRASPLFLYAYAALPLTHTYNTRLQVPTSFLFIQNKLLPQVGFEPPIPRSSYVDNNRRPNDPSHHGWLTQWKHCQDIFSYWLLTLAFAYCITKWKKFVLNSKDEEITIIRLMKQIIIKFFLMVSYMKMPLQ